jgi:hypothetical protein
MRRENKIRRVGRASRPLKPSRPTAAHSCLCRRRDRLPALRASSKSSRRASRGRAMFDGGSFSPSSPAQFNSDKGKKTNAHDPNLELLHFQKYALRAINFLVRKSATGPILRNPPTASAFADVSPILFMQNPAGSKPTGLRRKDDRDGKLGKAWWSIKDPRLELKSTAQAVHDYFMSSQIGFVCNLSYACSTTHPVGEP